jgi:hypothetical protein
LGGNHARKLRALGDSATRRLGIGRLGLGSDGRLGSDPNSVSDLDSPRAQQP